MTLFSTFSDTIERSCQFLHPQLICLLLSLDIAWTKSTWPANTSEALKAIERARVVIFKKCFEVSITLYIWRKYYLYYDFLQAINGNRVCPREKLNTSGTSCFSQIDTTLLLELE